MQQRGVRPRVEKFEERLLLACTVFWDGGANSNSWHDSLNWSTDALPGANDDVCIDVPAADITINYTGGNTTVRSIESQETLAVSGGSLRVTAASAIQNGLSLSAGMVEADGIVTMGGESSWAAGILSGSAGFLNEGTLTISGAGQKKLGNAPADVVAVLSNSGTIDHVGTAGIGLTNGLISNLAGGMYDLQGDGTVFRTSWNSTQAEGVAGINNAGTFHKSLGNGIAEVQTFVSFNNTGGTITVDTGTIKLTGAGTNTGGTINVASGALLDIAPNSGSTTHWTGNYDGSGPGFVHFTTGTLTIGSSGATFNFPYRWLNGTFRTDGVLTSSSSSEWVAGTIQNFLGVLGPAFHNTGTLTLTGGSTKFLTGAGFSPDPDRPQNAVLNNSGTIVHAGTGGIFFSNATVRNLAGAVYDFQADTTLSFNSGGHHGFFNSGTVRKSAGAGTSNFAVFFIHSGGAVDVESGIVRLSGGSGGSGATLEAVPGTMLDIASGGNYTGTYAGAGLGTVRLTSQMTIPTGDSATFNFTGAPFVMSGSGASLALFGTFNNAGNMEWSQGTIRNALGALGPVFNNVGSMVLSGAATKKLEGNSANDDNPNAVLMNSGTILHTGSGGVWFSDATVRNLAGGLFDFQADTSFFKFSGDRHTFFNAGTLLKSAGSGLTDIGVAFDNNAGTVEVRSGSLDLHGFGGFSGGTLHNGAYRVIAASASSATLRIGGSINTNAATIFLDGANSNIYNGSTGTANALANFSANTATGNFTIQNDRNVSIAGAFSNAGAMTIGSNSTFTIGGSSSFTQISGSTTLTGGTLRSSASTGAINFTGGSLMGSGTVIGNVTNGGLVSPGFSPGIINVTGNYTQGSSGNLDIEIGGYDPGTEFDQLNISGCANLGGTLNVSLINGFIPNDGDSFDIITFASRCPSNSDFSTKNGLDLGDERHFEPVFGPTGLSLTTVETDTTPPPSPLIDSHPNDPSNSSTADFEFSDSEVNVNFLCSLDAAPLSTCTSPQSYSDLDEGVHTFEVVAVDAAGNQSPVTSFSWEVDLTPPPAPTIDSGPDSLTNSTSATFVFSDDEPGVTFECRLDNSDFTSCTSPQSYSGLSDGSHTFVVRVSDAAGNMDSASRTWTVDTIPPDTNIHSGPANTTNNTNATFTFSSSEAGSTFECSLDGDLIACHSPQPYSDLSEGTHTFAVRAVDAAGNVDGESAIHEWTIDTTAPDTTISSGPPNSTSTSATFQFSSSEPDSMFQCSLDGAAFSTCTSPQSYSGLAVGPHTFQVRATDEVGNTDPVAATHTWTIAPTQGVPGKITGGGNFDSGKRQFSFVVQPKPNGDLSGNLDFQDKLAGSSLKLKSTAITSIAIQGNQGVFTGSANVNGTAGYSFRVTVLDYGEPGTGIDKFRIQITGPGLQYDSDTLSANGGLLSGGNIQIHKSGDNSSGEGEGVSETVSTVSSATHKLLLPMSLPHNEHADSNVFGPSTESKRVDSHSKLDDVLLTIATDRSSACKTTDAESRDALFFKHGQAEEDLLECDDASSFSMP